MTHPRILLPVRVPELGPALGKVLTGTGRAHGTFTIDRFRLELVGRLFEAAGEARRLAAAEERDGAIAALDAPVWQEAWEKTASDLATMLVERVNRRLAGEARAVRMPRRMRRQVTLDASEVRGVTSRLGASAARLVPALDDVHAWGTRLREASPAEREALDRWQAALVTAAGRTEAAWLSLEDAVDAELARWDSVAETVARWRRPWWPVVAVGGPAVALALWLGLVLGGYLAAPAWLRGIWAWFS
jgi:hypothetical protein